MSAEMLSVLGMGVAILTLTWRMGSEIKRDIADLRERMARLEGLFEGFTGRQPEKN